MIKKFLAKMASLFGVPVDAAAFGVKLLDALAQGVDMLIDLIIQEFLGPIIQALFEAWPDIEQHLIPACFFGEPVRCSEQIVTVAHRFYADV